MHAAPGIGITAPHIGVPLRVGWDPCSTLDTIDVVADLCQSTDHLGIARDDPASGRQPSRLARRQTDDVTPSCARPDQLSRHRRQPADREIAGPARGLATSTRSISWMACSGSGGWSRLKRERLIKRFEKLFRS